MDGLVDDHRLLVFELLVALVIRGLFDLLYPGVELRAVSGSACANHLCCQHDRILSRPCVEFRSLLLNASVGKTQFALLVDLELKHMCNVEWRLVGLQQALNFVQRHEVALVHELDVVH